MNALKNPTASGALANMLIRCHNRPPYLDVITVQSGWHDNGTRRMVTIPNNNTKSCKFDLKDTQPGCVGCRWQSEVDARDLISRPQDRANQIG